MPKLIKYDSLVWLIRYSLVIRLSENITLNKSDIFSAELMDQSQTTHFSAHIISVFHLSTTKLTELNLNVICFWLVDAGKGCPELPDRWPSVPVSTAWTTGIGLVRKNIRAWNWLCASSLSCNILKLVLQCLIVLLSSCIFDKILLSYQCKALTNFCILLFHWLFQVCLFHCHF